MSLRKRFRAGPPARGHSGRSARWLRPLALVGLALLSLDGVGCSSVQSFRDRLSCSSCGTGGGLGLRDRLFSRRATPIAGGACCGGSAIGGEMIEVAPGPALIGGPAPVLIPGKSAVVTPGATVAPGADPDVPDLEAITPGASNAPASGAGRTGSPVRNGANGKTNYQTSRGGDAPRASRVQGLAQASPGDDASRRSVRREPAAAPHPLDHLPPLPGDASIAGASAIRNTPAPPAQIDPSEILAQPIGVPATGDTAEAPAPAAEAASDSAALGIRRFKALDTQVAGGTFPTVDGLTWLHDKGYRTIIDIRDSSEVRQSEVDAIAHLGMKHIRLPLNPRSIDRELVERFDAILKDSAAKPVFFCDTDGNRAGLMWFLHRRTADPVAADMAAREAEQVGLSDQRLLLFAAEYLIRRNKPAAPPEETAPAAEGVVPAPAAPADEMPPVNKPDADAPPAPAPAPPSGLNDAAEAPALPVDAAWNFYAAPMAALLCVPIAYWGRTSVTNLGNRMWASLPGPSRSDRSLPPAGSGG